MQRCVAIVAVLFLFVGYADAQIETGHSAITEGTSFLVAFPAIRASVTEMPLPNTLTVIITARDTARVVLRRVHTSATPAFDTTVVVDGGTAQQVAVSRGGRWSMVTESEVKSDVGITITSDKPISVATMITWSGNCERTIHFPVTTWGTEYRVVSLYQDGYDYPFNYHNPGQFLVIAAHDATTVTYSPTVTTAGGTDAASTPRGESRTVTLQRGQAFLVLAKIDTTLAQSNSTDLTGTNIVSNKPIAVISGHTKAAVMRQPALLPHTGMFRVGAHFVRGPIHESVTPNSLAGTEFVTAPVMHKERDLVGTKFAQHGVDDDRGDVIRFLAISDTTTVQRFVPATQEWTTLRTLRAGEYYQDSVVIDPVLWRTSRPAHCYQYGKSWAGLVEPVRTKESDVEKPSGHPSIPAGMPFLQSVPPIDRWINYALIHPDVNIDNFVIVVYKKSHASQIRVNGTPVSNTPSSSTLEISNTPYSCTRLPVTPNRTHELTSTADSITFAAWSYGTFDGLQQGRSYGHTLGFNQTQNCSDSLSISGSQTCTTATATITLHGSECARFFSVEYDAADNSNVSVSSYDSPSTRTIQISVTPRTPSNQSASAEITVRTRSGRYIRTTLSTIGNPQPVAVSNTLQLGDLLSGDTTVHIVTVINRASDTMRFTPSISGNHPNTELVNSGEIQIAPLDTAHIEIRAIANEEGQFVDTLWATTACSSRVLLSRLSGSYEKPQISIQFDTTSPRVTQRISHVRNPTATALIITGHSRRVHEGTGDVFTLELPEGTSINDAVWPLEIPARDSLPLLVRLDSKGQNGRFRETHYFPTLNSDTIVVNLDATLVDSTTSIADYVTNSPLSVTVIPSPVQGTSYISITGLTEGIYRISIVNSSGTVFTSETYTNTFGEQTTHLPMPSNLVPGVYVVRIQQHDRTSDITVPVVGK